MGRFSVNNSRVSRNDKYAEKHQKEYVRRSLLRLRIPANHSKAFTFGTKSKDSQDGSPTITDETRNITRPTRKVMANHVKFSKRPQYTGEGNIPGIEKWEDIEMRILIPCYKRAEFLDITLQSILEGAGDKPLSIYVADDGTPDDSIERVCEKYGANYMKFDHRGIVLTVSDLLRWGCKKANRNTAIYLSANDHIFCPNWGDNFRKAAFIGFSVGEMGMIDHPGVKAYRIWERGAHIIEPGVKVALDTSAGNSTGRAGVCSMPSIMTAEGAIRMAAHLGDSKNWYTDKFEFKRVQLIFQDFWLDYLSKRGQRMFAMVGSECYIEHFGHHNGRHEKFFVSPESLGYYGEVGRYKQEHLVIVVGTRPNFVKAAALYDALCSREFKAVKVSIAHTGQHYDKNLSQDLLDDLGLPPPTWQGVCAGDDHESTVNRAKAWLLDLFNRIKPEAVIVIGDVDSTVAGAYAAKEAGIPLIHVEAGLRSGDLRMPEERNRIEVDRLSDLLLVSEPSGLRNLIAEGVKGTRKEVGSLTVDSCLKHAERESNILEYLGLEHGRYVLSTMHRPSNVDMLESMADTLNIMDVAGKHLGVDVIWPMHPRTASRMLEYGPVLTDGIRIVDPVCYTAFIHLEKHSALILTDSGGIQEEATALGVPCITWRENTERPITVSRGSNVLLTPGTSSDVIKAIDARRRMLVPKMWDGKSADRAVEAIIKTLKSKLV